MERLLESLVSRGIIFQIFEKSQNVGEHYIMFDLHANILRSFPTITPGFPYEGVLYYTYNSKNDIFGTLHDIGSIIAHLLRISKDADVNSQSECIFYVKFSKKYFIITNDTRQVKFKTPLSNVFCEYADDVFFEFEHIVSEGSYI